VIPNCGSDCPTNTAPVVTTTSGSPSGPISLGGSVQVTANFTDASLNQTHTCTINWDDGSSPESGVVTEPSGTTAGSCKGSHSYAATGVYTVGFVISDGCSTGSGKYEFVVIFDPNGGFVTGGGWINSPPGAYFENPAAVGKANFGFVSKYKPAKSGTSTAPPEGETEFQFKAGDLNFHSSVYEWLVVSGAKAQYKGSGTVNNAGDFGFLLTATDSEVAGGGTADKFRIKIWNKSTGLIVYDNVLGASDDMDAASPQEIGGGSISIKAK